MAQDYHIPTVEELMQRTQNSLSSAQVEAEASQGERPLSEIVQSTRDAIISAKDVHREELRKRNIRIKEPIFAEPGQTATAAAFGFTAGLVKGLFSPVSAFLPDAFNETFDPWEEDSARKIAGMQARSQFKSVYDGAPGMSDFLQGAPSTIGEIAGSTVPFIAGYSQARNLFKVDKAVGFSAQLSRSVLAGATTGGALAAAAKLEPGESRWAKVAVDAVAMGAFEMIGIPAMRKAWREETPNITKRVAKELGIKEPKSILMKEDIGPTLTPEAEAWRQKTFGDRKPEPLDDLGRPYLPGSLTKEEANNRPTVFGFFKNTVQDKEVPKPLRDKAVKLLRDVAAKKKTESEAFKEYNRYSNEYQDATDDFIGPIQRGEIDPVATVKEVEAQLTAIRAGVPADEKVVDAVLNAAKDDKELAGSPIVLQAAKQKQAKDALQNPQVIIDPVLHSDSPNLAARVSVSVDGVLAGQRDILRDPANPQHLTNQTTDFVEQMRQTIAAGRNVKVESVVAGNGEDANNILNALSGKARKPPNTNKAKRKVPGAAIPNTVAENGAKPKKGARVKIVEEGKPTISGTVVDEFAEPDEAVTAAAADRFARSQGTVSVELPDKTVRHVPLAQLQVPLEVGVKQSIVLQPHPDGTTRRAIVHLDDGQVSYEPIGGSMDPAQSHFRSELFDSTNADVVYGRDPRLFIDSSEKGVTISISKLSDRTNYTSENVRLYHGGGQTGPGQFFTDNPQYAKEYAKGKGRVGYVDMPRSEAETYLSDVVGNPLSRRENADAPFEGVSVGKGFSVVGRTYFLPESIAAKWTPTEVLPFELVGSPELVSAKRTAGVLLKNGVSADTPVKVRIADYTHVGAGVEDNPAELTLRKLAETELPLANLEQLQDAAAERGLTAVPVGARIVLQSKNGFNRTFANSLEAHEAVLRIPKTEVGRKIEQELEAQWKMGSERAYDPDVDVTHFQPLEAQEKAIGELVQGKRPLVPVYTSEPKALSETAQAIEQHLGLPKNTIRMLLLPDMDRGARKAAVLFSADAVATAAAKSRDALTYLGVTARDPAEMLTQLSKRGNGHGIYVLSGRPADSAALYAKWREGGSKELWETGRVEVDSLGPHRRFPKSATEVVRYPGAGDELYVNRDLSDSVSAPEGVRFTADSNAKPRVFEEMTPYEPDLSFGSRPPTYTTKEPPPPGQFADASGPGAMILGLRFRPMMELSKDLQTRTGVPFYDWWRAIEVGRNKTEQVVNPHLQAVHDLASRLNRQERVQTQLLFEARIANLDDVADLEKKLSPKVLSVATALKEQYTKFFTGEGFNEKDINDFFSIFPDLRKADGNFLYAVKGRSSVPRIGQLLSKDLENGNIQIDSRELDFQRVANRIIRGTATERYLQPSWQRVSTELEAYSQAKRIPNDYASIFGRHLNEVLHMPDPLQMSLARATRMVFAKLGKRVSEVEAQDFVSMMTQMNYFANMAWKPSIVLRNLLQTLQTSAPIIGMRDTYEGWSFARRWWKDPKLQEEMVRRGVVQPGGIYAPMQEMRQLMEGMGGPKTEKFLDVFFNKGTRWHANTDDFNKVTAYWGQYIRAKRFAKEYVEKRIDWQTFMEESKLDMRDARNGPFTQEIKRALDGGAVEKAASRMGEEFAKSTQFIYTRGNAPYVMQSTVGRLFLQYGTWPMWYGENLRNMLMRGSAKNRMKAIARWGGVQTAMFGTANVLFGGDATRWVFFAPLGYTGGPYAQMGLQALQTFNMTVDPSQNDPVSRIARARLANSAIRQVLPLPTGAFVDGWRTGNALFNGSWQDTARAMVNLPKAKRSVADIVPF